jgi:hypothetical protein
LYPVNDASNGYVGPPVLLSSGQSLENSQCSIYGGVVSGSGNVLTLSLSFTFAASFPGARVVYPAARSATQNSGWQAMSTVNLPGSTVSGPAVTGAYPSQSATNSNTYTFVFNDSNGWQDLSVLDVLTNDFLDGMAACYFTYVPVSATDGYFYLVDDAGDGGYVAGSPMLLSSGSTLQNRQCTLNAASSYTSASGNSLGFSVSLTFSSGFSGNRIFYLAARNSTTGNSGWQPVGAVAVQ